MKVAILGSIALSSIVIFSMQEPDASEGQALGHGAFIGIAGVLASQPVGNLKALAQQHQLVHGKKPSLSELYEQLIRTNRIPPHKVGFLRRLSFLWAGLDISASSVVPMVALSYGANFAVLRLLENRGIDSSSLQVRLLAAMSAGTCAGIATGWMDFLNLKRLERQNAGMGLYALIQKYGFIVPFWSALGLVIARRAILGGSVLVARPETHRLTEDSIMPPTVANSFENGLIAGLKTVFTQPLDTLRVWAQTQHDRSVSDVFGDALRAQGPRGLARSLWSGSRYGVLGSFLFLEAADAADWALGSVL